MKKTLFLLFVTILVHNASAQDINSAQELIISGNYTVAAGILNNIIQKDSSNIDLYGKLAYCYSASFQYNKAIAILLKGIERRPGDNRFIMMLADNYSSCEMYAEAKNLYQKYLENDMASVDGQLKLVRVYIALKEWAAGETILKKLIGEECDVAIYYELLAKCQEALEDYNNAIINCHKSVHLNPYSLNNVIRLCSLYFLTERFKSAQTTAEGNLKYRPQSAELWRVKAEAQFKLEVYNSAVDSYKKALAYGDTSISLYRNMGICLYAIGKSDSAFKYLDAAFNKKCDDYITSLYLGKVLKELGRADEAELYIKKVEAIQTDNYVIESFIALGNLYQQKKDYEKSIEYFSRALEFAPEKKSIFFRIAAAYDEAYTDKSDALKYYEQYTSDSSNTDSKLYDYAVKRINQIKKVNQN